MKSHQFATPWDALLRPHAPIRIEKPPSDKEPQAKTKVERLLNILARAESLTTLSLSVECDLTERQVWGLLKGPKAAGQVTFETGRWSLVPDYPGRNVQRAADLLRRLGWTVEPPEGNVA